MKRFALPTALLLAAGAIAAQQFRYEDRSKNMVILAQSGRGDQLTTGNLRLDLRGNVSLRSTSQGTSLAAGRVVCDTASAPGGKSELQTATATGAVRLVKTVMSGTAKGQQTNIASTRADYRRGTAADEVRLAGPVTIRNVGVPTAGRGRQTLVATGASGRAQLEPGATTKRNSGLRTATLSGPVRVTVVEAAQGTKKGSTVVATGNQMLLDYTKVNPTVTLIGNVRIEGQGDSSVGTASGLSRAVLRLNQNNELLGFNTEAG